MTSATDENGESPADHRPNWAQQLLELSSDGLLAIRATDCVVTFANQAAGRLVGKTPDELLGKQISEVCRLLGLDKDVWSGDSFRAATSAATREDIFHRAGGGQVAALSTSIEEEGRASIVIALRLVRERGAMGDDHAASEGRDPLTGLPDRNACLSRLDEWFRQPPLSRQPIAVMFIDLDDFKTINDTYGHLAGDAVLEDVAHRLQGCARSDDLLARFGGDEFVLVVTGDGAVNVARQVEQRIAKALEAPIEVSGHEVVVAASMGIEGFQQGMNGPLELIHAADAAMYRRKRQVNGELDQRTWRRSGVG